MILHQFDQLRLFAGRSVYVLLSITRDARGLDVWYLSLSKMVLPDKTVTETTSNFPHYSDWLYSNLTRYDC